MKLMIVGHARHGKDTAAEILRDEYGLKFTSSSWFVAERVMMPHFDRMGRSYESVEACFADRINHRQEWFDVIAEINARDLAKLTRLILAENDVYVGNRNNREFYQAKCEGLFHYSIFVDAYQRLKVLESSMTISQYSCDFTIDNNGTVEDLRRNLRGLMKNLGLEPLNSNPGRSRS